MIACIVKKKSANPIWYLMCRLRNITSFRRALIIIWVSKHVFYNLLPLPPLPSAKCPSDGRVITFGQPSMAFRSPDARSARRLTVTSLLCRDVLITRIPESWPPRSSRPTTSPPRANRSRRSSFAVSVSFPPSSRCVRVERHTRFVAFVSSRTWIAAMALNPTASNDHMVNKVAVCSAVFAGFAYVGYSVAKNVFGRRPGRKTDDGEFGDRASGQRRCYRVSARFTGCRHENQRLYFRRLSQTTQTDVLLGNLDNSDGDHVFLRPMTVQQRIKQLNLRARMFADTMMAIQTPSNKHSLHGPRSLQVSISRTLNCTSLA